MQNLLPEKTWWAPVWKGLVIDAEARHYRQMRNALWLYLYFLLHANRRSGLLQRKLQTISRDMGVSRDTVLRWLNALRDNGYVATSNTGRSLAIQVHRWKPIVGQAKSRPQQSELFSLSSGRNPTVRNRRDRTGPMSRDRTVVASANSKERRIKIIEYNERQQVVVDRSLQSNSEGSAPWDLRERLAQEIAKTLEDPLRISLYRAHCWRHSEALLRQVLREVSSVPAHQAADRPALFTKLLKEHAR